MNNDSLDCHVVLLQVMRSDILRGDKTCGWVTVEDHVDCGCQCNLMETECGTDMHVSW